MKNITFMRKQEEKKHTRIILYERKFLTNPNFKAIMLDSCKYLSAIFLHLNFKILGNEWKVKWKVLSILLIWSYEQTFFSSFILWHKVLVLLVKYDRLVRKIVSDINVILNYRFNLDWGHTENVGTQTVYYLMFQPAWGHPQKHQSSRVKKDALLFCCSS